MQEFKVFCGLPNTHGAINDAHFSNSKGFWTFQWWLLMSIIRLQKHSAMFQVIINDKKTLY